MYKLIIVEDESQMNKQLTKILDWENIGFEIAASFENGADAIEYINHNHVDAVLTDIRVPVISGIELSKICHTSHPNIKFVFISAYRNFEYARSAIRYNVVDYVTKPITYSDFFDAMVSLYNEIDKLNHISALEERSDFLDDEIVFMRQEYLSSYVLGVIDSDTLIYHLGKIGIAIDKDNCTCAQIKIKILNYTDFITNTWTHERDRFYNTVNKFITPENDYAYFSVSQYINDTVELMVIGKDRFPEKMFTKIITEYMNTLTDNLKMLLKLDITYDILQLVKNISSLKKYQVSKSSATQLSNMVMSYIHNDSPAEAMRTLQIVKKIFSSNSVQAEKFCRHLFSELSTLSEDPYDLRIQFLGISDVNRMFEFLADQISELKGYGQTDTEDAMDKAMEYIKHHYTENLTLADVSHYVALSSGYFSSLFKQKNGEKFIDYLSKLRIAKARELLENSAIKITAIANLVGYKDAQYFHRVFKLYTGKTPSQYRQDAEENNPQ